MTKVYNVDTTIDLLKSFLWQYDKAGKIKQLLENRKNFNDENVTKFWDNWITNVFNIDTATTFGLDLWGSFLDVRRPTYEDGDQTIVFSDDQYRVLLKGRILLMNSNGSIADINRYLNYLFPNRSVFCVDYYNMSINLVFYYTPTAAEMAIIQSEGFLPRPAGVQVNYVIVPPDEVFGFDGQELSTFDNGTFLA